MALREGNVVGVINVQHRKPHVYSDHILKVLTTIARQVSGAIENARAMASAHLQFYKA
jgi:GAF domain-containing protein